MSFLCISESDYIIKLTKSKCHKMASEYKANQLNIVNQYGRILFVQICRFVHLNFCSEMNLCLFRRTTGESILTAKILVKENNMYKMLNMYKYSSLI